MNHLTFPYLPGIVSEIDLPLARYLPPVASGMVSARLKQLLNPGDWVLDPFGSTPILPLEAAEAGYKVLVASNNPVLSFILEVMASAPTFSSLQAALSELADLRRGAERLEIHLQSLYQTECAACGETIQAQAFLWKRGETQPYARLYHCPQCGDEGERAVTPRDLERLSIPGNPSLHRARAFERVNLGLESIQESIQEALNTYLARPLYFLNTLINRIEGLPATNPHRKLLSAMALVICDEANTLWTYPAVRQRPRQLATPPQFRENNLWLALEKSIQNWTFQKQAVPFTCWPDLPPAGEGGICLYPGRLKALLPLPEAVRPKVAIGVFPRPNQAFWTLSAIWSGWLWGKEAVLPLKGSLERQRYDWNWYAVALHSTFSTLRKINPDGIPLTGFLPELAPGFLAAAVVAGSAAGYDLDGLALREEHEFAQADWRAGESTASLKLPLTEICQNAIMKNLSERNEPTSYINLFAGCLESLSTQEALSSNLSQLPLESLTHILPAINQAFTETGFLKRYESTSANLEIGKWWLSTPPENTLPLADRVEIEVVHFLQKHPGCSLAEVDEAMCRAFPGLMTPPVDLIEACLTSYAEAAPGTAGGWHLRPGESAAARKADLLATHELLERLAVQVGYECEGENPLIWTSRTAGKVFQFYPIASSIISRYVLGDAPVSPSRCVLVLPGSRSNLLAYKLKGDPRLAEAVASGWRFLKFRHLRELAKRGDLSVGMLEEQLSQDPPILESPVQMTIF